MLVTDDPRHDVMTREFFGPILSVFVYDDWDEVLPLVDGTAPYALTGAVFAQDPYAVDEASQALRFTAGNFYVNDKPTGAVVGQQPFGGAQGVGHQRQGRLDPQPAPLDLAAHPQDDVRAAARPPLPAHGLAFRPFGIHPAPAGGERRHRAETRGATHHVLPGAPHAPDSDPSSSLG